jgi:4-hydroxy-tetrahydrodipicolinate synthase
MRRPSASILPSPETAMDRRNFLQAVGGSMAGLALSGRLKLPAQRHHAAKPLHGIFPIAQSPFTEGGQLDLESLVAEVRFLDRCGVHGLAWPQLASEWPTLSPDERFAGAEAIATAGRTLQPAIVIGVQAPDTAAAVRYAKHARQIGADAIISLPPPHESDPHALLEYYKEVGAASDLPMFAQTAGDMSVDLIIQMYQAIPTLRYVKDEVGQPLARFDALRRRSAGQLSIFTGSHGRTLIDEMMRGFAGTMPASPFADLYVTTWDLWHAGKTREAIDVFGKATILINEVEAYGLASMKYILCLRGVFKTYRTREAKPTGATDPLDATSKDELRRILDLIKPDLRA